jgi:lipoprotein-releasing system permease protein
MSMGEVMIGKVGANLKGVDMARGTEELRRWATPGSVDALARPAHCPPPRVPGFPVDESEEQGAWTGRIILGEELAQRLRVKTGACVSVLVPIPQGGDLAAPPPVFRFKVVGTFRMGFHEYDTRLAFVNLEDAKVVGGVRQTLFGIELRFDDPMVALEADDEVERRLGPDPPRVVNWKDLNHNLFMALAMQKTIIALFLVLIIVVAAFNILASLTMIVLGKVREIAILASMGAGARSLRRVFVVAGTLVGFVGNGLGLAFGLAVCGLASLYGYPLDPKVYLIAELPVQISIAEMLAVAGATQAICMLATLYPAFRASRLKVVEGLRHT